MLAMELLSPEALGGAGVTIGGVGVLFFVNFVYRLGGMTKKVEEFLDNINKTLERQVKHFNDEEVHQQKLEESQVEIIRVLQRSRPTTGEHPVAAPPG